MDRWPQFEGTLTIGEHTALQALNSRPKEVKRVTLVDGDDENIRIINAEDFDPSRHEEVVERASKPRTPRKKTGQGAART